VSRWPIVALALCGCQATTALDLPSTTAASFIFAVTGPEGLRGIEAYDAVAIPTLTWHEGDVVHAFPFTCDVARLGLQPGPQPQVATSASQGGPPPDGKAYELTFAVGESSPWTLQPNPPTPVIDAIGVLPFPEDAPCRTLGARYTHDALAVVPQGLGTGAFIVPIDDTTALVGTSKGQLFRVDLADKIATRLASLERPEGEPEFKAATRAPDGQFWLITRVGTLYRGTIEAGFTEVMNAGAHRFSEQPRYAMVSSPAGVPFELFVASNGNGRSGLGHFGDDNRWITTSTHASPSSDIPAVAWLGPRVAVAVGGDSERIFFVVDSQYGRALISRSPITSIINHPTLGPLVGNEGGDVLVLRDNGWSRLSREDSHVGYVRTIVPEGPGFVYTGIVDLNFGASGFGQYHTRYQYCASLDTLSDFAVSHLARVGPLYLLALTRFDRESAMGITVITRTQEPSACVE